MGWNMTLSPSKRTGWDFSWGMQPAPTAQQYLPFHHPHILSSLDFLKKSHILSANQWKLVLCVRPYALFSEASETRLKHLTIPGEAAWHCWDSEGVGRRSHLPLDAVPNLIHLGRLQARTTRWPINGILRRVRDLPDCKCYTHQTQHGSPRPRF